MPTRRNGNEVRLYPGRILLLPHFGHFLKVMGEKSLVLVLFCVVHAICRRVYAGFALAEPLL